MIRIATTEDVTETLGLLRTLTRLTQRTLADRADVHQGQIADWERGPRLPSPASLIRLLRALGYQLAIVPIDTQEDA